MAASAMTATISSRVASPGARASTAHLGTSGRRRAVEPNQQLDRRGRRSRHVARLFGGRNPRDAWAPVDARAARAQNRTASGYVQSRPDGAMTYYKFAAWRLGCFFDAALQVDPRRDDPRRP